MGLPGSISFGGGQSDTERRGTGRSGTERRGTGRPCTGRPVTVRGAAIILALVLITPLTASEVISSLPDTAPARRSRIEVMTEPLDERHRASSPVVRELITIPGSEPVLYRREYQRGNRYDVFIPAGTDRLDLASPGTFIVRRRLDDGEFDQIKVFLQYDEGSYIRLFPDGLVTRMDVYVADIPIYRDVPVSMSMERALSAPLELMLRSASGEIDWAFLDVDTGDPGYRVVEGMIDELREALPSLPDAEDGAMDEYGNMVFIETLVSQEELPGFNCSGFAKWVVDGIYRQRTGRYLSIDPLKRKHLDYRGTSWSAPLEDARNPFFGLDWTRNLAIEIAALDNEIPVESIDPESRDVREVPVARYIEDVGYRIEALRGVLYHLARTRPGTFYLGSVNRLFGSDPVLRQHTHVVALFPYFDTDGRFHAVVMERNVETGVASLERRYPGDFIHLVSIPAREGYRPPEISIVRDPGPPFD